MYCGDEIFEVSILAGFPSNLQQRFEYEYESKKELSYKLAKTRVYPDLQSVHTPALVTGIVSQLPPPRGGRQWLC